MSNGEFVVPKMANLLKDKVPTNSVEPTAGFGLTLDASGRIPNADVLADFSGTAGVLNVSSTGSLSWAAASTGATVASTVAGLGTASDGKIGLLRAGSSPYEFVYLIYDSTYAKWVSPTVYSGSFFKDTAFTTASTSYGGVSQVNADNAIIQNYKAVYDAGLRLQVYISGFLSNSGANTTYLQVSVVDWDDTDTAFSAALGTAAEISVVGTTATLKASGWTAITATPTQTHGAIVPQAKVSAGTGTYQLIEYKYRWVST